ncbi:hypothetical protein KA005_23430, partial [bacterium]|nr:hypothetical protein [bacterium]
DNYHTGFVLRMLYSIWKLTEREDVYRSLKRCYVHYISNFFEDNEIPKLLPNRKYRVDIHSCAESINCLGKLAEISNNYLNLAKKIANYAIENMQNKDGSFSYARLNKVLSVKLPYMRYSQAPMFRALCELTSRLRAKE